MSEEIKSKILQLYKEILSNDNLYINVTKKIANERIVLMNYAKPTFYQTYRGNFPTYERILKKLPYNKFINEKKINITDNIKYIHKEYGNSEQYCYTIGTINYETYKKIHMIYQDEVDKLLKEYKELTNKDFNEEYALNYESENSYKIAGYLSWIPPKEKSLIEKCLYEIAKNSILDIIPQSS